MEEKNIPYLVHEEAQAKSERTIKRLILSLLIAIILIFACNALWLYAWMQYDYASEESSTETVTVDGKDGIANYIGGVGSIINGKDNSEAEGR